MGLRGQAQSDAWLQREKGRAGSRSVALRYLSPFRLAGGEAGLVDARFIPAPELAIRLRSGAQRDQL